MVNLACVRQADDQDKAGPSGGTAALAQTINRGGGSSRSGWLATKVASGAANACISVTIGTGIDTATGAITADVAIAAQMFVHDLPDVWPSDCDAGVAVA